MMHNLCDFIKDELKELDRKAANGKLNMQELQYADLLAHAKKSLLTVDAMEHPEDYGYGDSYGNYSRGYMAGRGRNARRDSMGRYADDSRMMYRDNGDIMDDLHALKDKAPNEHVRRRIEEFISEMKTM